MKTHTVRRTSPLLVLACAALACAAPSEGPWVDFDVDEPVDVEPEPVGLLVSLREASQARAPVEGATCAVGRASRVPIEAVTDARGFAHFELDGWRETLSVSCARGHVTSLVGLRSSDVPEGRVELALHAEEPTPPTVALYGEIHGERSAESRVFVQASAGEQGFEAQGAERYALHLRRGLAFWRVAIETGPARAEGPNDYALALHAWSVVAHPPVSADTHEPLELTVGQRAWRYVDGSVGLPTARGSVLRAPGFVGRLWTELEGGASPLLVGLGVESGFEGEDRLAFRAAYVEGVELSGALVTRVELSNPSAPHFGRSELWLRGALPEGAIEARLVVER